MKILYAIQGTGNGHISRAMDLVPRLRLKADVDVLLSGIQADLPLPFDVKFRMHGLSFIFGKRGGVDYYSTFMRNTVRSIVREVRSLPVEDYDLVISDFEPVSAWACKLRKQRIIGLSHQAVVMSEKAPQPEHRDAMGTFFLRHYAPAADSYGFHFQSYDKGIFTPVIRREVREQVIENKGHFTVYLPAYDDEHLIRHLRSIKDVQWHVFSKHCKQAKFFENIFIQPINNERFIESMASAEGVLCGAGFETPAECLFMGKKLMVIPMKNQYEQHFNAAALRTMGVPVIKELTVNSHSSIREWTRNGQRITVNYPEISNEVVELIVNHRESAKQPSAEHLNVYG